MQNSATEENYLKAIYKFSANGEMVGTNTLAKSLQTTPASVTDMLKRLSEKSLVEYQPYHGVRLLEPGKRIALKIIRKHRLWEVFLVNTLHFTWDEVHETAEELEHVNSPLLIDKLDEFLGFPQFDPHGDPIPNKDGLFTERITRQLSACTASEVVIVAGVTEDAPVFLQYLDRIGIRIGSRIIVHDVLPFDNSLILSLAGREVVLSGEFARQILIVEQE
jgi:DtxR family transcriptional regulator, Mn-dependent transcriptional regulator